MKRQLFLVVQFRVTMRSQQEGHTDNSARIPVPDHLSVGNLGPHAPSFDYLETEIARTLMETPEILRLDVLGRFHEWSYVREE